jgi:signal transduction histidine kinase
MANHCDGRERRRFCQQGIYFHERSNQIPDEVQQLHDGPLRRHCFPTYAKSAATQAITRLPAPWWLLGDYPQVPYSSEHFSRSSVRIYTHYMAPAARQNAATRYALAVSIAILALLLRKLLAPVLGAQNPYHTAWAAVAFSAWYCGLGPSVLAVLIELAGVWYWFLPPFASIRLTDPRAEFAGMTGFLVFSGFIIGLAESTRRALDRSRVAEEKLRQAHSELEEKVRQRTIQLQEANAGLRELSGRLQQMRDEERRSIARELHDSVGQLLAALNMNIESLQTPAHNLEPAAVRVLTDSSQLLQQITREVRTISYLLHPPLLDLAGLASALRWYADGFSERSKIRVEVEIPEAFRRLSGEMEIAIFRMVQECLTNIHRHSGSDSAQIIVRQEQDHILVQVADTGKGIPLEKQSELASSSRTGIGFRGMRERLRQLGGELDIRSDNQGTVVAATLPLSETDSDPKLPTAASA